MFRRPFLSLAACALAAVLSGCGETPLTPAAAPAAGIAFDLTDGEAVADSGELVLWPSDAVYDGPLVGGEGEAGDGMPSMSMALAPQPNIRIGVVQSSDTVRLGGTGAWTIRDKANGVLVMTGPANTAAIVTLAAVPESYIYFQVMCASAASVSTRKAAAEALGYYTLTALNGTGTCTQLMIGRLPTTSTGPQRTAFKNTLISQGLAASDAFARTMVIGTQVLYKVARGSTIVQNVNPVVVTIDTPGSGHITIGTAAVTLRRYRGKGEARMNSAAKLAGINELPMEQYLYGVLPAELNPNLYPEIEAQKAQAVAARTYAMAGLGKRANDGYDLRATTDDQVYSGYAFEHAVSNAAIDATAGVVATYNGKPISTNFFSASGGHTADSEEAFTGAPVAYQRGVPDQTLGQALAHVPSLEVFRAHANPRALRNAGEEEFEADWASYHRWTYEWSAEQISSIISTYAGRPVGRVLEITVTARGPSGRALAIDYVTETGVVRDTRRDGIRGSLRYINANGNATNLPSTLFFVEPVRERGQHTGGFRVYGGGFGHGVGLSQTGAVGMAQKGHEYQAILRHYFQGIAVEAKY